MKGSIRLVGYGALGLLCFAFFVYWTFPYQLIKERIAATLEKQLGGSVAVAIEQLSPSWFTGVKIKGFALEARGDKGPEALLTADRVKLRVGLFSLLTGSPKISYQLRAKGLRLHGAFRRTESGTQLRCAIDAIDLAELGLIKTRLGLPMAGTMEGDVMLQLGPSPAQHQGEIRLRFRDWKMKKGKIPVAGFGETELKEDLWLTKGEDSGLVISIGKGAAEIKQFTLAGGDLSIDLKGQAFLAQKLSGVRLNVSGQFAASGKAEEPFGIAFVMIKNQKQPDGNYPVTIAGNLNRPQVKIGDFLIPF